MKDKKTVTLIWWICLLIMSVSGLIISVSHIADIALPDLFRRVIGIVSLAALAAVVFSSAFGFVKRR